MKFRSMVSQPVQVPRPLIHPEPGPLARFHARNRAIREWFRKRPRLGFAWVGFYLLNRFMGFHPHKMAMSESDSDLRTAPTGFWGLGYVWVILISPVLLVGGLGSVLSWGVSRLLFGREDT